MMAIQGELSIDTLPYDSVLIDYIWVNAPSNEFPSDV